MSHFNITCPEDYQKYFHVNEQGHVWLDGRNNPIPLTQNLPKRINAIQPQALWSGRNTRSGVHSKDTPPQKGGPHNSTGNTQAPPSLGTPTSPIPTDQEIQRDIIQGVLDDPKIPKSLLGTAWEETKNLFSPYKVDQQKSQDTSHSSDSANLGAAQSIHSSHPHHKSATLGSNKSSDPQSIDINMVMDHVKSLEHKIRKESEQLEINRVKHESDLRNMSQQYETQINKLISTHQQQISDFEAQIQAKHNEMLALKNQISTFNNSQPHSYTTPPPPQPHSTYQPHSYIWQNNAPQPSYINNTVVDILNQSILQQAQTSKEQFLNSAKTCDGTNPKDFESWLEEVDRLSDVTGKSNIAVAIFTARGSLYNHIKELQNNKHEWDVIKQKLLERFSEFGSAIMAKHKLNTLKQNDTPMHEYISKFTSLTRHAYNVDPSTPQTEMLILPFIDSLQNPFIKSKIRLRNSKTLSDIFQHALEEDTMQKVRAVDFGEPTSSNITQCDINAIRDNKGYKCVKDGHFIKDCPLNQDQNSQYHHRQDYHKGGYSPLKTDEPNSENTLATLAKAVNDLSLLLKEHTQKSHNSFQAQNNKHTHQHHRHSSHTKNSYYNKPDHIHRHRSQNTQYSSKNRSHHSSHNRPHNRQQHKYNAKINEIDDLSDCSPDCSDRSDCEDYCTDHETQEVQDPKN